MLGKFLASRVIVLAHCCGVIATRWEGRESRAAAVLARVLQALCLLPLAGILRVAVVSWKSIPVQGEMEVEGDIEEEVEQPGADSDEPQEDDASQQKKQSSLARARRGRATKNG